ncbi:Iron-sulfur cluster assembly protein CyaY [bioreactor metagenome]|uniref:Iron-sulfur cluster assembly protein CyaY n=1 Tax=bioreactor metagenome TaxID=1076179 RepID=A0A645ILJ6_9ZZZZ
MNDAEFNALADATLARLEAALEAAADAGAELDYELAPGGVLEIEFDDGTKMVVNRHGVAREIWVAAKAGGFHFRAEDGVWKDTRDGVELFDRLEALMSAQAGQSISLR